MQQRLGGCLGICLGALPSAGYYMDMSMESKSSYLKLRLFCHSRRDSEEVCVYRSRFHETLLLGCCYPFVLVWVGWYYTVLSTSNWNQNFLQIQKGWRWNTFSPKPWLHINQSKLRVYINHYKSLSNCQGKKWREKLQHWFVSCRKQASERPRLLATNRSSRAEPAWKNMKVKINMQNLVMWTFSWNDGTYIPSIRNVISYDSKNLHLLIWDILAFEPFKTHTQCFQLLGGSTIQSSTYPSV